MQKTVNNLTKSVLGFGLVILLASCSSLPQTVEISAKPVEKPQLILPPVDQVNMRSVDWVVINQDNLDEKISQLTSNGKPLAMFVLTGDGYSNLGLNFSDIRALVQQQKAIIVAYEEYYQQAEETLDNAVTID
jgi:hypothetical protein